MAAFVKWLRMKHYTTLVLDEVAVARHAPVRERTILQPDGLRILFTIDTKIERGNPVYEDYINAYRFEVSTGLRPGEVLGLLWKDIREGIVYLRRSRNRYGEVTSGKNENARRNFALTPYASYALSKQLTRDHETGIKSEYVFHDADGDPIKQNNYYRHWQRYCESNGLPRLTAYELRHTFVSVVKRLPEGYLKPLIGHTVDMDSYGTYSHEMEGDLEKTAALVGDIFAKILPKITEETPENH